MIAVTKRWKHHTASGGFDRLADSLGHVTISRREEGFGARILRRSFDRGWKSPELLLDYKYGDLIAEKEALRQARRLPGTGIHYLYGDEQLNWILDRRRRLDGPLFATFHLPWFRSSARFHAQRLKLLDGLDGAVAVSSALARDLSRILPEEKVFYVPHGIDLEVFQPRLQARRPGCLRLLTVGFHMRDLNLVHRLIDNSHQLKLDVEFQFIGPKSAWSYFTGCQRTELRSDVSEGELIGAYHDADALLLPVEAATANNSLLEALACGLPVISTQADGIVDYLDDQAGWLIPKNELDPLQQLVCSLAADPTLCERKRVLARAKACNFGWERVAVGYREIFSGAFKS